MDAERHFARRRRGGGQVDRFLIHRAARIFPVFLPVFALAIAIYPTSCGFERMPWVAPDSAARLICVTAWPPTWPLEIAAHLTMTHGLFPLGPLPGIWISFLGPAWSLTTEWQFYLVALLAARGSDPPGGRTWDSRLRGGLIALALAGLAWHWMMPEYWQFSRALLANKAHFFALGVASVAVLHRRRHALPAYGITLLICEAICAGQGTLGKTVLPLLWTFCLAVQMRPDAPGLCVVAWLLRSRVAQYLGAISYCLYLVNEPLHKLIAASLSRLVDGNAAAFTIVWLPCAIGLPILAAAWLHTHVERPAMRWARAATPASSRERLATSGPG